ncbi:4Fe-4S binding protein [Geofilum sp. OHC36d9]|uniref:4Fe-4S binding protein n=1 Tax=Geofilum sp. OHC36d9 TaxID=3458413 RepID=UPI0040341B15
MRQSGGGAVVADKAVTVTKSHPAKEDFPVVDAEVCIGCGTCIKACPMKAISFKDSVAWINAEMCRNCRKCVSVCPVDAIH